MMRVSDTMIRARKVMFAAFGFVLLSAVSCRVSDGRSPAERQAIADALLAMLHSPLTNEVDLKMDDPRIPEVIRRLNPMDIQLAGNDAVVMCDGKPGEYHLNRPDSQQRIWILYVAGSGYNGHQ